MNYGMGNKLQDEINPIGHNGGLKDDLEMIFWTFLIISILKIFFN